MSDRLPEIFSIIFPVVTIIGIAYLSKRKQLVNQELVNGLKTLVMSVTLPALMFNTLRGAKFDGGSIIIIVIMYVCHIIGLLLGKLIVRVFGIEERSLLPYLTSTCETGMMGYGLYNMLFAQEYLYNLAIVDIGPILFVFSIYVISLNTRKGISARESLKNYVKSPIIIAITLGILFSITGLGKMLSASGTGPVVTSILTYVGAPTGMLVMFVVGYGLEFSRQSLRDAFFAAFCRMLIMGGLCAGSIFLVGLFIPVGYYMFYAIVLIFTLPAAFILPMYAVDEKDGVYISTSLSLYTLVSIAAFAVVAVTVFANGNYPGV
ncbi:hypothetical protein FACS189468_4750 [Spirochaetia bacterium]|nr:hypothetical protein FACS189468_4750 [Spirochaetia bacterium]